MHVPLTGPAELHAGSKAAESRGCFVERSGQQAKQNLQSRRPELHTEHMPTVAFCSLLCAGTPATMRVAELIVSQLSTELRSPHR